MRLLHEPSHRVDSVWIGQICTDQRVVSQASGGGYARTTTRQVHRCSSVPRVKMQADVQEMYGFRTVPWWRLITDAFQRLVMLYLRRDDRLMFRQCQTVRAMTQC